MNSHDIAQDLLAAYSQIAGVPGLKFEPHGCARLLFEESVAIDLEVDDDARCIQVYAVLGMVPPGNRETMYRRLLESNFFGTQTDGATLAIDGTQDEVLLCRRVDLATATAAGLAELLERFAGTVRQWHQRFNSGQLAANDAPAAVPEGRMDMYLRG